MDDPSKQAFNKYKHVISFTVQGEAASKANSRQLVYNKHTKRPMFIKSAKARGYVADATLQIPRLNPIIPKSQPVFLRLKMFYASRRPDMDEAVLLDVMQGLIYENDRQVRDRWTSGFIDAINPRVEVEVYVESQSEL